MYYFFFDLDDTLMPTSQFYFLNNLNKAYYQLHNDPRRRKKHINIITNDYQKYIQKDLKLYSLLSQLNFPKYIITNGSRIHCMLSLKNLGIMSLFRGGIDSNSIHYSQLKPNIYPYLAAMEMSKMDLDKDKCIFFDDIPDNHIVPKTKLNWITVLIGTTYPPEKKPYFIDWCFPDIYQALLFFIQKQVLK